MSEVLDLDALVPSSAIVKFDGREVEVMPPKTVDVLKLGSLGQKLQEVKSLTETEVETLVRELQSLIVKVIPDLNGKELNTVQLLNLVKLIGAMSMPPDTKELEKQGITAVNNSPKAA